MDNAVQAYMAMADSERQTIWARNSAMLVAHTLLLAAITIIEPQCLRPFLAVVGLCVCGAWWVMTYVGWRLLDALVAEGSNLPLEINPLARLPHLYQAENPLRRLTSDPIKFFTMFVIAVFVLMYLVIGGVFLAKVFCNA